MAGAVQVQGRGGGLLGHRGGLALPEAGELSWRQGRQPRIELRHWRWLGSGPRSRTARTLGSASVSSGPRQSELGLWPRAWRARTRPGCRRPCPTGVDEARPGSPRGAGAGQRASLRGTSVVESPAGRGRHGRADGSSAVVICAGCRVALAPRWPVGGGLRSGLAWGTGLTARWRGQTTDGSPSPGCAPRPRASARPRWRGDGRQAGPGRLAVRLRTSAARGRQG